MEGAPGQQKGVWRPRRAGSREPCKGNRAGRCELGAAGFPPVVSKRGSAPRSKSVRWHVADSCPEERHVEPRVRWALDRAERRATAGPWKWLWKRLRGQGASESLPLLLSTGTAGAAWAALARGVGGRDPASESRKGLTANAVHASTSSGAAPSGQGARHRERAGSGKRATVRARHAKWYGYRHPGQNAGR